MLWHVSRGHRVIQRNYLATAVLGLNLLFSMDRNEIAIPKTGGRCNETLLFEHKNDVWHKFLRYRFAPLLVPQCHHRIHTRGAPRGEKTGTDGHTDEQERSDSDGRDVRRLQSIEQIRDDT